MKPDGTGEGNGHPRMGMTGSGLGITHNDPVASELNSLDGEIGIFDSGGADAPATGTTRQGLSRRRRKLITGACLLMLLVVSVAVTLYFMLGGNRTPLNLKVRDTRAQESKTQAARQDPDEVTSQAIAEVRSAMPEAGQTTSAIAGVTAGATRVSPDAPVTVPLDGIGGTVSPSVTGTAEAQAVKGADASAAGTDAIEPASRRNPERSIRCALPAAPAPPVLTAVQTPQHQREQAEPASPAHTDQRIVLPPFGSMLPVRTLGVLYTLRPGSLARFELTRDVRGQGWSMRKGTVLVGASRGSEYDRAYLAIVGFIEPESGRLVKLTGDVLGGDGGSGLRGRRRSLSSAWSRAFNRIGTSAVNVAGLMLSGLGRDSVIISDAYGYRVVNPVTSELGGMIGERANQQRGFVEVAAGAQGYVMVTDLPQEIQGVDALAELSAKDVNERADVDTRRASTGLSERELADLLSSGSVEQIRAALPRMTPQMRRVAEAVIAESGN